MLAAMREAARKWDKITVNGSERDKALAVELAVEHGFKIGSPELQDKIDCRTGEGGATPATRAGSRRKATWLCRGIDRRGAKPKDGRGKSSSPFRLYASIRMPRRNGEVRQAERSMATNERPIDGGGKDHASPNASRGQCGRACRTCGRPEPRQGPFRPT
ncbi:LPD7 domain-containing protein [Rhizobium beringeri]